MTQNELHNAVARVTGESIRTISARGFGLADPASVDHDPEPYFTEPLDVEDKIVEWDRLDVQRRLPALV